MDCSTIIVSYNTFELTQAAIRSALEAASGIEHEVIVVDNGSPDNSGRRLQTTFAATLNVKVITNERNIGFTKANNQGARAAKGNVLLFLNPDTIVKGQAIKTLYEFLMQRPAAGAVGPHVLNFDGSDQSSVGSFFTTREMIGNYLPLARLMRLGTSTGVPSKTGRVDVLIGCALAVRREPFEEVGGWDESYFMYAEEFELCYALSRRGYTNYFVREAKILHLGGASSIENYTEQQVAEKRSALQFLRRHHGHHLVAVNRALGILGFGGRIVVFTVLARVRPADAEGYRRRGRAAAAIFNWFVRDYS